MAGDEERTEGTDEELVSFLDILGPELERSSVLAGELAQLLVPPGLFS